MDSLTLAQARRISLAAQGLHRPGGARAGQTVTMRQVLKTIDRLQVIQIDSVNVLARAHLMPLFSRLGPYDTGLLDRAATRHPRRLVEAWAHEASFIPPETYPLLAWRRRAVRTEAWGSIRQVEGSAVLREVREIIAGQGPLTATQVHALLDAEHPHSRENWGWNWSIAKRALEYLFFTGEVMSAGRNGSFERKYDLTERVLPASVLNSPPISDDDAVRALLEMGARAHGIGTFRCFRDYFRLRGNAPRTALAELVEDGVLSPVRVSGWDEQVYLHSQAVRPRSVTGTALLSPFDPLIFERTRVQCLFGMRYRIEIYVPAAKRVHGYYVLPFLEDGALTARVDLKADRKNGTLRVLSAHSEREATADTPQRLDSELRLLAQWLGLEAPATWAWAG